MLSSRKVHVGRNITLGGGEHHKGCENEGQFVNVVSWLRTIVSNQSDEIRYKASQTLSNSFCTLSEMYNIKVPMMSCMGIIHDFRRPRDGIKTASTIGDHKSFSEYG